MKVTLQNTTKVVTFNGVMTRVWEGVTEGGIPCHAFVAIIAVENTVDTAAFDRELLQQRPPSAKVESSYPAALTLRGPSGAEDN